MKAFDSSIIFNIQKISLGTTFVKEKYIWLKTKSRQYSTQSFYLTEEM